MSDVSSESYPNLAAYTHPVKPLERPIVGRQAEMKSILAAFERPELCNILLLGEAGSGKTAIVQGVMAQDESRAYLEVNLAGMLADLKSDAIADGIKHLFDEVQLYGKTEGRDIVLFMDEFHQLVHLSTAAVEAMKPMLADSGTRGVRVICATTYEEFERDISSNQPLVERLMRINLVQPDEETCVEILRATAQRYGVDAQFYDDHIFHDIYEATNRYIPANSQPRKSILILDAMIGWHRFSGRPMNDKLLGDVIYETEGVRTAFTVDAKAIQKRLDEHVLSQTYATQAVAKRLQLCVAGLNDPGRPMSSFLLSGSTGVGKCCTDDTLVPVFSEHGARMVRHGDLKVGDKVFSREGKPISVAAVYPKGKKTIYRVMLEDGRSLDVGGEHLWRVYTRDARTNLHNGKSAVTSVVSTKDMYERGVVSGDASHRYRYFIDAGRPVAWPRVALPIDPYVMGVFLAHGQFDKRELTLMCDERSVVQRVTKTLQIRPHDTKLRGHHIWTFTAGAGHSVLTKDFFEGFDALIGARRTSVRVPAAYLGSSIEQRFELVRGLFDMSAHVRDSGGRLNVEFSTFSAGLADDVAQLLFSLGISNTRSQRAHAKSIRALVEYRVHVRCPHETKQRLFYVRDKRNRCIAALARTKQHVRQPYCETLGIANIVRLTHKQAATCIYVDDAEHLYQAGQFIVTHNTELSKQLANILFSDERSFLRFDMTEYTAADSQDRFRDELTRRVWERPFSIILLDEIEKAAAEVCRLLLQVLDDGRLSDRNGREVSFLNAYVILTTNAGSEVYKSIAQYDEDDTGSGKALEQYQALIRRALSDTTGDNRFPPELIGRIDTLVPFQPLSEQTMKDITLMRLHELHDRVMEKHNVYLEVGKNDVIDYLVKDVSTTDSDAGGARQVMARLTDEVTTNVAAFVNNNPDILRIHVGVVGDTAYNDKHLRTSRARIEVRPAL